MSTLTRFYYYFLVPSDFYVTGSYQSYQVSNGTNFILVTLYGASGADGAQGRVGGLGGVVKALVPVSPGQMLYVYVGDSGSNGGFNGGGTSGSGNGGGASDVRTR